MERTGMNRNEPDYLRSGQESHWFKVLKLQ